MEITIKEISEFSGKYAKFTTSDDQVHFGKYGYFSYLFELCRLSFGSEPDFPVRIRIDSLEYFHTMAIFHNGVWIKLKRRGY